MWYCAALGAASLDHQQQRAVRRHFLCGKLVKCNVQAGHLTKRPRGVTVCRRASAAALLCCASHRLLAMLHALCFRQERCSSRSAGAIGGCLLFAVATTASNLPLCLAMQSHLNGFSFQTVLSGRRACYFFLLVVFCCAFVSTQLLIGEFGVANSHELPDTCTAAHAAARRALKTYGTGWQGSTGRAVKHT